MIIVWLAFLLAINWHSFTSISEINEKTRQAAVAYKTGRFAKAAKNYEYLVYEIKNNDPKILLNLAHAYRRNNQPDKAKITYLKVARSRQALLRSIAWDQLGTLETKIENYTQALTFYKRALIANPNNAQARYNYELLKKYLKQNPEKKNQIPPPQPEQNSQPENQKQPDQKKDQENQNQNKPDQEGEESKTDKKDPGNQQEEKQKENNPEADKSNPENQEKPGQNSTGKPQKQGTDQGNEKGLNPEEEDSEPNPEPPKNGNEGGNKEISGKEKNMQTQYERLRQMNISPEKAEMMLDAMKNAEQQYLQQLPKKATKKPDRSKPDW